MIIDRAFIDSQVQGVLSYTINEALRLYSSGKENFDLALTKCRLAGKYPKAERKITNVLANS